MSEKFCLQGNDFQENIKSAFENLREVKNFSDVTRVTSENIFPPRRSRKRSVDVFWKSSQLMKNFPSRYILNCVGKKEVKFGHLVGTNKTELVSNSEAGLLVSGSSSVKSIKTVEN